MLPHIDTDPIGGRFAGQQTCNSLNDNLCAAGFIHGKARNAPGCVAAGLGLAAVRVPDAHEHIAARRRLHTDELVTAHAGVAIRNRADRVRREIERTLAGVNDNKIVAQSVHLEEADRIHVAPYMGLSFRRPMGGCRFARGMFWSGNRFWRPAGA